MTAIYAKNITEICFTSTEYDNLLVVSPYLYFHRINIHSSHGMDEHRRSQNVSHSSRAAPDKHEGQFVYLNALNLHRD